MLRPGAPSRGHTLPGVPRVTAARFTQSLQDSAYFHSTNGEGPEELAPGLLGRETPEAALRLPRCVQTGPSGTPTPSDLSCTSALLLSLNAQNRSSALAQLLRACFPAELTPALQRGKTHALHPKQAIKRKNPKRFLISQETEEKQCRAEPTSRVPQQRCATAGTQAHGHPLT